MVNDRGHFRYADVSVGADEVAAYTSNFFDLQPGSDADDLEKGVAPYDYASLELNTYITSRPKPLADDEPLGYVPEVVSNSDGTMPTKEGGYAPSLSIAFKSKENPEQLASFMTFGITIHAENVLRKVKIRVASTGSGVETLDFSATKKDEFFSWSPRDTFGIIIYFSEIDEPGRFLRVYSVEFGRTVDFSKDKLISVEMHSTFPMLCDSIAYDTLNLHVLYDRESGFFFLRRQPMQYIGADGKVKRTYYVDSGETVETAQGLNAYSAKLSAYDAVSTLEDNFLGKMYENAPVESVFSEILKNMPFEVQDADGMTVSGFLPPSTRREALALLCRGTNLRPYRGEKMVIKPIESSASESYGESEIVAPPSITSNQEVAAVALDVHHYSKGNEEKELYHWYVSTTREVTITWSDPVWSVKAYEVTGEDENGNDVISETESGAVTFVEKSATYCRVTNTSSSKIVLKGMLYVDSIERLESYDVLKEQRGDDQVHEVTNQTLLADGMTRTILYKLAELYTRSSTFSGKVVDAPAPYPGESVQVLGTERMVTSVKDTLTGLYEMEAT